MQGKEGVLRGTPRRARPRAAHEPCDKERRGEGAGKKTPRVDRAGGGGRSEESLAGGGFRRAGAGRGPAYVKLRGVLEGPGEQEPTVLRRQRRAPKE